MPVSGSGGKIYTEKTDNSAFSDVQQLTILAQNTLISIIPIAELVSVSHMLREKKTILKNDVSFSQLLFHFDTSIYTHSSTNLVQ